MDELRKDHRIRKVDSVFQLVMTTRKIRFFRSGSKMKTDSAYVSFRRSRVLLVLFVAQ